MSDTRIYNPLDKRNLGASVMDAMLEGEANPLESLTEFEGAGIYALYYEGAFPAYETLVTRNRDGHPAVPIYVGKAVPVGARKGDAGLNLPTGKSLYKRLAEHRDTLHAARNLDVKDFQCRFLVVDDIWIPLAESLLITRFAPLWNKIVDGFGNHDPGSGRYQGVCPRWDVLHPGREWAARCKARPETAKAIESEVVQYLLTTAGGQS